MVSRSFKHLAKVSGAQGNMKIVLQDQKSGMYFQAPGRWVSSPEEAHQFLGWTDVMFTRKKYRLTEHVHMVFRFEEEGYLIQVPLEGHRSSRAVSPL